MSTAINIYDIEVEASTEEIQGFIMEKYHKTIQHLDRESAFDEEIPELFKNLHEDSYRITLHFFDETADENAEITFGCLDVNAKKEKLTDAQKFTSFLFMLGAAFSSGNDKNGNLVIVHRSYQEQITTNAMYAEGVMHYMEDVTYIGVFTPEGEKIKIIIDSGDPSNTREEEDMNLEKSIVNNLIVCYTDKR